MTRSVLPAFAYFRFKGVSEYLEVVVARINAPQLSKLDVAFFNDIVFDTPQFTQFIRRTPMLKGPQKARVTFEDNAAVFNLSSQTSGKYGVYGRGAETITVGLASFVYGADLYPMFTSPSHFGAPLHLREPTLARTLARQHRECTMAGTATSVYICEEPLHILRHCATYRACPARTR